MKIDLSTIDKNHFNIKEGIIAGNPVYLINPRDFGCEWTKDNLHLRSILIDKSGKILSRGFNKFFNAGEKPDLYPNPEKFNDLVWEEKADGSLMICDYIFDNFNARTRGIVSYKSLENAQDFDFIFNKYPKIIDVCRANPDDTYLFEIFSPNNRIVLSYGDEPDIKFLGFIHKPTGLYYPAYSKEGEFIKTQIGCKSPEIYKMGPSLLENFEQIKKWEKLEGCVIKYNDSQNFLKQKADWYLWRHRLKSQLNSLDNLVDLFLELKYPGYDEFFKNIETTVDFETAKELEEKIWQICDAYHIQVLNTIREMEEFVIPLFGLPRKEAAIKILGTFKDKSSFLFQLLDGKKLDEKSIRKLLDEILKNE